MRNDVYQPWIVDSPQDISGSIRRVVIYDDHIEIEIRLLTQCALDGVQNRAFSISHWNNDAGPDQVVFIRCRHALEAWLQPGANALEMLRRNRLHFPLVLTILRINVIELLLAGRA